MIFLETTENWIPDDIVCITSCPKLEITANLTIPNCAHTNGIDFSAGTQCDLECDEGFEIAENSIECLETGDWSVPQETLVCEKIMLAPPVEIRTTGEPLPSENSRIEGDEKKGGGYFLNLKIAYKKILSVCFEKKI